ncbi:MAG TPA: lysophospholipid acyltransferase family protein [Spongiibacteraceae bacterium]
MISVEHVVTARFPDFPQRNPAIYKTVVALLRHLFREVEFRRFGERYPHLTGFDFVEQALDHFDFGVTISDRERERIPAWGRVVIIANHPIGSLDGLALLKLVGEVRRDVKVVANDVLAAVEPLRSLLLSVDAFGSRTTRDNLRAIEQHLQNDGALIIFPAGAVSRMGATGVRDGAWRHGFLRFATKTRASILPVCIDARNSIFFYSLSILAKPLSTLWLVREMFKHNNKNMRVRIGQSIAFETYATLPLDSRAKVKLFRRHIYKIGKNRGEGCFETGAESIARPEDRQQLRAEIRACELLGTTKDGMRIYLYRFDGDSSVMREIGRLREVSFRAVGEGCGRRRDMDVYDRSYDHIALWDDEALELVGAYRLRRTADLEKSNTPNCAELYSSTLFDYREEAGIYLAAGVELGRSFVQPRYWGRRSLDLLWLGIGAYVKRFPQVRYLFGPVSISNSYPSSAKDLLVNFYRHYFSASIPWATARLPYQSLQANANRRWSDLDYSAGFAQLKAELTASELSVPTLYKQYTELCENGGVHFVDFNVDPDFSDCIDGLVLVDLHMLKESKRKRYLAE